MISDAHEGLKRAIGAARGRVHPRQLHSTNPLERLNKELKRRSTSLASSPISRRCCSRSEPCSWNNTTNGRWPSVGYFSAETMKQLTTPELAATTQEILATIM